VAGAQAREARRKEPAMALQSYARLTCNGTALEGVVTTSEIGGVDVSSEHLELSSLTFGLTAGAVRSSTAGRASGRRQYEPIVFVKRIDRSTPLLYQALAQNQRVDGDFKLFDLDPVDGTVRHFFTIGVERGGITGIESVSPDVRDPDVATWDAYERVSLSFATITLDELTSGTSFEDSTRIV
jgi:type VI secretion system secreted protein Hcp